MQFKRIRRPVFFGENGSPAFAVPYQIDAYHPE
jgi:hypothetical protein